MNTKPTNPKDRMATNRLDLTLFPSTAIAYGALAMTEGDCKYGGYNYRVRGVSTSTYIAALFRHIGRYYNGQWADPKTKVPHLGSALACIAVIVDAYERNVLNDDRPPKVDMQGLLEQFEGITEHLHSIFKDGPERYTEKKHGKKKRPASRKISEKKLSLLRKRAIARKGSRRSA